MLIDLGIINHRRVKVGDTLIFNNGENNDIYIVVHNPFTSSYQLLCPATSTIRDSFEDMGMLTDKVNDSTNGFNLIEVLSKTDVTLKRADNE